MKRDLEELLELSSEDLKLAKKSLKLEFYRHACFLSHQSSEKILKAYLLSKSGSYPFVHSLEKLIYVCIEYDVDFRALLDLRADALDDYYTGTRYPPVLRVSEDEAREAVEIAEGVREFGLKKLMNDMN